MRKLLIILSLFFFSTLHAQTLPEVSRGKEKALAKDYNLRVLNILQIPSDTTTNKRVGCVAILNQVFYIKNISAWEALLSGTTNNLQVVTDAGNTTTNAIFAKQYRDNYGSLRIDSSEFRWQSNSSDSLILSPNGDAFIKMKGNTNNGVWINGVAVGLTGSQMDMTFSGGIFSNSIHAFGNYLAPYQVRKDDNSNYANFHQSSNAGLPGALNIYFQGDRAADTIATLFDVRAVSGGGTVTSVSGTANRITSTGGATPVIDISATFEALLLKAANNLSDLANAGTARTNLGLVIGTNVQAYDADLTTYAGITPSANVQSVLSAADYAAIKTLLSLNNVDNTSDATKNSATATLTNKTIDATANTITGLGYVLQGSASNAASVPDATSTYFGSIPVSAGASIGANRIYIPKTGTIKKVYILFDNSGTLASNETSTIAVRLNATTDFTISAAVTNDAAVTAFNNTGMSAAVTAGDFIAIKWTTPTWATNPTNVRISAVIYIE